MALTRQEIRAVLDRDEIIRRATSGPARLDSYLATVLDILVADHPELADPVADAVASVVASISRLVDSATVGFTFEGQGMTPRSAEEIEHRISADPVARQIVEAWSAALDADDLWAEVLYSTNRPDYLTGEVIITGPANANGTGFTAWRQGRDLDPEDRHNISTWRTAEQIQALTPAAL